MQYSIGKITTENWGGWIVALGLLMLVASSWGIQMAAFWVVPRLKSSKTAQRALMTVLILLGVGGFIVLRATAPEETPEEVSERQEAAQRTSQIRAAEEAKSAAEAAAEGAHKNELCHYLMACRKYGTARQECAVAGDFNSCIQIKMGKGVASRYSCTNDGKPSSQPTDMPGLVECFFRNLGND
jgi:hypothetical protein